MPFDRVGGGEAGWQKVVWGSSRFAGCPARCRAAAGQGPLAPLHRVHSLVPSVSRQADGGPNSKAQNGLLSPPQEEKLTNSQTSLCEILQEKGRWAGVSLDQSALLPLRFKNIREKTDVHFVDVIKEDR